MSAASKTDLWLAILRLDRPVFTTRELAVLTGRSMSSVCQGLRLLVHKKFIQKAFKSVYVVLNDKRLNPFTLVPYLSPSSLCYVSFVSALHARGVISQIPRVVTVATTAHSKKIKTPMGVYVMHRINPAFFGGYEWDRGGHYLIASVAKAFADCFYISSRRGGAYGTFPELDLPRGFSRKKVLRWVDKIPDHSLRKSALKKLKQTL